jgi:hypothetical protein
MLSAPAFQLTHFGSFLRLPSIVLIARSAPFGFIRRDTGLKRLYVTPTSITCHAESSIYMLRYRVRTENSLDKSGSLAIASSIIFVEYGAIDRAESGF